MEQWSLGGNGIVKRIKGKVTGMEEETQGRMIAGTQDGPEENIEEEPSQDLEV